MFFSTQWTRAFHFKWHTHGTLSAHVETWHTSGWKRWYHLLKEEFESPLGRHLKKMLRILKNIILVTLPTLVVLAILLEIFFRIGIPASNPPRGYFDEEALIYRFLIGQDEGLFTIGPLAQQRGRWRINNVGWNSPVDYELAGNKPKVAVIGDSYIAALQVDSDKSYPALVNAALDDVDVYSFGVSGAPLSHYLHMSRYVGRTFDPDTLVINLILNDFAESIYDGTRPHWLTIEVTDDGVEEVQPRRNPSFIQYSRSKQLLRHSALVRYTIFNLKLPGLMQRLTARSEDFEDNTDRGRIQRRRDEVEVATSYVMNQIRLENPDRRIIYVIDGPKQSIYAGSEPSDVIQFIYRIVTAGASESGSELLNLWPAMQEQFRRDGVKFNSEHDGHWDEYGHAFVAMQFLNLFQD